MRGMRVRGLDVAAGVSLVVCLATVGIRVSGERGAVVLQRFGYRHGRWAVVSKEGVLAVSNQPQWIGRILDEGSCSRRWLRR